MPEGPETHRMADRIHKSLVGKSILKFKFQHDSISKLNNLKTVSIIDDYDRLTMALAFSLEHEGYTTFKFTHPKEALSFHKTTPADFYIIDIKFS